MWDEIKNSVLYLCIRFEASHLGHIQWNYRVGSWIYVWCGREIWDTEILMESLKKSMVLKAMKKMDVIIEEGSVRREETQALGLEECQY